MEQFGLDEILFCPAQISPHKEAAPPLADPQHRRAMTALAVAPIKGFSLLDLELDRSGPSYTIDTVRELMARQPSDQFHLVMGEDLLSSLELWKEVETLLQLAPPLIGTRTGELPPLPKSLRRAALSGLTRIPIMEISSTHLRERLSKGFYCGHLIPLKVLDYIYEKQLY